jgi:hypothetical protein
MSKTISDSKQETATRCIKIDNWIFEVKSVRAIRADEYGQPYTAIANINLHGDKAFIDGLMTNSNTEFERVDFETIRAYLHQLDITKGEFDRFKNQEAISKSMEVTPSKNNSPTLQLVS